MSENETIEESLKQIRISIAHLIFIATVKWLLKPESTTNDLEKIINNIFYPEEKIE
jgi:hypothetical protein